MNIAERRVVVTGGTEGLGKALVVEFARRNAKVGFIARTRERVLEVEREVEGVVGVVGDVSRKDDIHRMAMQLAARLGGVDVLVHNASSLGVPPLRLIADTDCEGLELALATNVVGPHRLTRALMGMLARSARDSKVSLVITISSDAAVNAYPNWGAYGASKAALLHWTRVADEEMRELGIRFVSVDPGDMDTALHALALPDSDRAALRRPADAARDIADIVERTLPESAS